MHQHEQDVILAEGILISGLKSDAFKWLSRGAAAVMLLPAASLLSHAGGLVSGLLVLAAAIALLVAGELLTAFGLAARRWVVDTGNGLRWIGGPTEIRTGKGAITGFVVARLVTAHFASGLCSTPILVTVERPWAVGGVECGHEPEKGPSLDSSSRDW